MAFLKETMTAFHDQINLRTQICLNWKIKWLISPPDQSKNRDCLFSDMSSPFNPNTLISYICKQESISPLNIPVSAGALLPEIKNQARKNRLTASNWYFWFKRKKEKRNASFSKNIKGYSDRRQGTMANITCSPWESPKTN